jgi:hypothetical protein
MKGIMAVYRVTRIIQYRRILSLPAVLHGTGGILLQDV